MTVTYAGSVDTSKMSTTLHLLLKWKGSIYSSIWKEYVGGIMMFYFVKLIYLFALNHEQKIAFQGVVLKCIDYSDSIPLAFVLGFYVSVVVSRWWDQFILIPWPDRMAFCVLTYMQDKSEKSRIIRRTIMRYLYLAFVILLVSICSPVKRRFPTLDHVTAAGIITEKEQEILENMDTPHNKYFVPCTWAASLLKRARNDFLISNDFAYDNMIMELNNYRARLGDMLCYDWVNIPLVYTQVVGLTVYVFFGMCLFARQQFNHTLINHNNNHANGTNSTFDIQYDALLHSHDFAFPIFTSLQFFFYVGWVKVAKCMLNPFGDDDDDFDMNYLIDRNLQISYLIVDEASHNQYPELTKDLHWDEENFQLPYTEATKHLQDKPVFLGSTKDVNPTEKQAEITNYYNPSEENIITIPIPEEPSGRSVNLAITPSSNELICMKYNLNPTSVEAFLDGLNIPVNLMDLIFKLKTENNCNYTTTNVIRKFGNNVNEYDEKLEVVKKKRNLVRKMFKRLSRLSLKLNENNGGEEGGNKIRKNKVVKLNVEQQQQQQQQQQQLQQEKHGILKTTNLDGREIVNLGANNDIRSVTTESRGNSKSKSPHSTLIYEL